MNDTLIIPLDEAKLALDLAAANMMEKMDESIAMSDSDTHNRLQAIYTFHRISGPFAELVLQTAIREGKRKMMKRQPVHVRYMATQ